MLDPQFEMILVSVGTDTLVWPFQNLDAPAIAKAGKDLFYKVDGHWNTAGQALAAGLVAEAILKANWLR